MPNSTNPSPRIVERAAPVQAMLARMDEKLNFMEEVNRERQATLQQIATKQETQQHQLNALATDMAVLRTQHASFWKAASALVGILSVIGAVIGWLLTTFLPLFRK